MQFTLFLLLSFTAIAAAFTLPSDAADGFYVAYYNETGHEVHLKNPAMSSLNELVTSNPTIPRIRGTTPEVLPRDGETWCGCGLNMDPTNCDVAVDRLKGRMKDEWLSLAVVKPGEAWYEIRRSGTARPVVTFLCNTSGEINSGIDVSIFTQVLADITGSCGLYVPGTKAVGSLRVGYMNYNEGEQYCVSATGSPSNKC